MRVETHFRIYYRGKATDFASLSEAKDEVLFMQLMYNRDLPIYIVETCFVGEQQVGQPHERRLGA